MNRILDEVFPWHLVTKETYWITFNVTASGLFHILISITVDFQLLVFLLCIIIIIIIISIMQGIYTYIPETNPVPKQYSVTCSAQYGSFL
jgi:hypothetical protein